MVHYYASVVQRTANTIDLKLTLYRRKSQVTGVCEEMQWGANKTLSRHPHIHLVIGLSCQEEPLSVLLTFS